MIYSNDPLFEEAYTIDCATVSDEPESESIVSPTQPNQVCDKSNHDVEHWKYMAEHERGVAKEEKRKEDREQRRREGGTEENCEKQDKEADTEVEETCLQRSLSVSSVVSCQCSSEGPDPSCPHCRTSPLRPLLLASPPPAGDLIALQHRRQKRLGGLCL